MIILVSCSFPGNIPKSSQMLESVWEHQFKSGVLTVASLACPVTKWTQLVAELQPTGVFPLWSGKGGTDSQPPRVPPLENRVKKGGW